MWIFPLPVLQSPHSAVCKMCTYHTRHSFVPIHHFLLPELKLANSPYSNVEVQDCTEKVFGRCKGRPHT